MAIYTTFFLCKPDELLGGFPGWLPPLEQPVRREFRNPFTGELSVVESREPEWRDEGEEPSREFRVVEIQGRYEDYLEGRLPPFVRSCPHWATKGLTQVEVGPLCEVVGVAAEFDCPIHGPPSVGASVQEVPSRLLPMLASLDQEEVANHWAEAMSTPEHTHSISGDKLSDGWTVTDARELLNLLVSLAREATAERRLYLLTET